MLLLLLVTVAVFHRVAAMEFLDWDDHINVSLNPLLNPVTPDSTLEVWRRPYFTSYIPVTRTVWAALAGVARVPPDQSGVSLVPRYFHIANLLVHVLNVLLVFAILRLLIRSDWSAAAGAGLFALHPAQVEPVAWVTGIKDLLGAFFALIALWQYLIYAAQTRDGSRTRWRRLHYALASGAFVLAVLSKQTVLGLPLVAWALDAWVLRRPARERLWPLAGWIPVALGAAVIARLTQGPPPSTIPTWPRFFIAGDALAFYLWKLAVPVRLGPNYGRTPAFVLSHPWGYATWLVPCALAVLLWLKRRAWPLLAACGVAFVVPLLPVLGLAPFRFQGYSTVADRYLYLALLGPALALAWALSRTRSKVAVGLCVLGLGTLGALSFFQTSHWRNNLAFFSRGVAIDPDCAQFHNALAVALRARGQSREAYGHWATALAIEPRLADAHYNLGMLLADMGQPEQALEHYQAALRLKPDGDTHLNIALALVILGRDEEAATHFEQALRLQPGNWLAHAELARVLSRQGRYDEAEGHFREAIRLRPDYAPAYQDLGLLYRDLGRSAEAEEMLAAAKRLQSGAPPADSSADTSPTEDTSHEPG